jgi:hypothetical protein
LEVVITDWPAHILTEEIDKLVAERQNDIDERGKSAYSHHVHLRTAEKIDVYQQLCLNWKHFINYLWKELRSDA